MIEVLGIGDADIYVGGRKRHSNRGTLVDHVPLLLVHHDASAELRTR